MSHTYVNSEAIVIVSGTQNPEKISHQKRTHICAPH